MKLIIPPLYSNIHFSSPHALHPPAFLLAVNLGLDPHPFLRPRPTDGLA